MVSGPSLSISASRLDCEAGRELVLGLAVPALAVVERRVRVQDVADRQVEPGVERRQPGQAPRGDGNAVVTAAAGK